MGYADGWEKKTPGDRIVADRSSSKIGSALIIAETSVGDQLERGLQYLTGMDGITHSRLDKESIFYIVCYLRIIASVTVAWCWDTADGRTTLP